MGRRAGGCLFPLDTGGYGALARPVCAAGGAPQGRGSGAGRAAPPPPPPAKAHERNLPPRNPGGNASPPATTSQVHAAAASPGGSQLRDGRPLPPETAARPGLRVGRPSHNDCGPDAHSCTRYQFSSRSDDIRTLFTSACDLLESLGSLGGSGTFPWRAARRFRFSTSFGAEVVRRIRPAAGARSTPPGTVR
jgi:hypothetical protein